MDLIEIFLYSEIAPSLISSIASSFLFFVFGFVFLSLKIKENRKILEKTFKENAYLNVSDLRERKAGKIVMLKSSLFGVCRYTLNCASEGEDIIESIISEESVKNTREEEVVNECVRIGEEFALWGEEGSVKSACFVKGFWGVRRSSIIKNLRSGKIGFDDVLSNQKVVNGLLDSEKWLMHASGEVYEKAKDIRNEAFSEVQSLKLHIRDVELVEELEEELEEIWLCSGIICILLSIVDENSEVDRDIYTFAEATETVAHVKALLRVSHIYINSNISTI